MKVRRSEARVLDLLVLGRTNKEIALALAISARTVEHHVKNIMERTGIYNRVGLAIWWHDLAIFAG